MLCKQSVWLVGGSRSFKNLDEVAWDRATYSCPCVKMGSRKSMPMKQTDCPWALLMVNAKARHMGNWWRRIWKESPVSVEGMRPIRGMKVICPWCWLPIISTSRMCAVALRKMRQVPLHKPHAGARFQSKISGQPGFRWSSLDGRPDAVMNLKYSTGMWCESVYTFGSDSIASAL